MATLKYEKNLKYYYGVGDKVEYLPSNIKGEVIKVTKSSMKIKCEGSTILFNEIKYPLFLEEMKVIL